MNKHPNFLVIMSDQQSPHVLGHARDPVIRTPHLDGLARTGVRFTSTYCGSPLCVPSRMTFLTARHCSDIEVWGNGCILDSEIPTFPGALAAAGYETVLCGRMHFWGPDQRHGFKQRTIGDISQLEEKDGSPLEHIPKAACGQNRKSVEIAGPGRTAYQVYDDAVTESCCRFLEEWDRSATDQPLLLTVGYVLPHCPFICPPDLFEYYYERVDVPKLPADYLERLHPASRAYRERREFDSLTEEQIRVARAAYYGLVEYHDRECGKVLAALRKTRFADNTVVIYVSDHGEMAGEHHIWTKSNFYEGSVGVPMIWSWPGHFREGAAVNQVTSLLDVGPTLLDLADVAGMQDVAGRPLSGFLSGSGEVASWPDDAFSEYCGLGGDRPGRMIREGPWKLIHYHGYEKPQLFNLENDPGEWNDRSDDPTCQEIREHLHRRVQEGWDAARIEGAMQGMKEREKEAFSRAARYALPKRDFWKMPPHSNIFPILK